MSADVIDSFTGDHRFLSNFSPARVICDGVEYPTVEHAYQAAKCVGPVERTMIASAATPGHAKQLGGAVSLQIDWSEIRVSVMAALLTQKFASGPLRVALLRTGTAQLIEGNRWHDQFWGDCRCGRASCAEPGANQLGRLLMAVRDRLAMT